MGIGRTKAVIDGGDREPSVAEGGGVVGGLGPGELLALHSDMALLRAFDEQAVSYQRQGRLSTYAIFWGHEAMQVGAVRALAATDWVFPSYRELAVGLLRGISIEAVLSWLRGEPGGSWNPYDSCVANVCVPVGTHVPHAVGFAWGSQMKGSDSCALVFFGDGATSEGAFHEGLTFAGVVKAPVVLFCNNNGWAMSTPVSAQTGAEHLADKAVGYGIEAVQVDGGDVLAVYNATTEAIERARAGEGATLIEAITYRMAPHSTADDSSYLDGDRVQQERQRECLTRYEKQLTSLGVLTEDEAAKGREAARARIRTAMAAVEQAAPASPAVMFDHVYAEPPLKLLRDKATIEQQRGNQ